MTNSRPLRRLPNMPDRSAIDLRVTEDAARQCIETLSLRGYARLDTPTLEQSELFIRKSGGELSSRLYEFTEPGGVQASLRPEFTASVVRHAIESGDIESGARRFQYFGPVFRYATSEHKDGKRTRQFNQLGAELSGIRGPRGDGEIIAMALEGLDALGVESTKIVLGHVGLLWNALDKYQLSERARLFLVTSTGELRAGEISSVRERAVKLGFLDSEDSANSDSSLRRADVEAVLTRSIGPLGANVGSRSKDEIVSRLARKLVLADDPTQFESALSMLSSLVQIEGPAANALSDGKRLASENGLDEKAFDDLESVISAAIDEGVSEDRIFVRLGMARGVAYYTGMVFDITLNQKSEATLGGGGRYDGLIRALGVGADVPALGFAYNFDAVVQATKLDRPSVPLPTLIRPADESAWKAAVEAASKLRKAGKSAVLASGDENNSDFAEVITVGADGNTQTESGR